MSKSCSVVVEITWLRSLLSELQCPLVKPPLVWCDNLSTVLLSANPVLHARTKHIELDLYFVREKVIQKEVEVHHQMCSQRQFPQLSLLNSNTNSRKKIFLP